MLSFKYQQYPICDKIILWCKFVIAKDCLLTGQEQACNIKDHPVVRSFVWLGVTMQKMA